jgi:hypothetical protein
MRRKIESQRGTVLMVAMILVLLLSGLAVAYVAITGSQAVSTNISYKSDRALYLAEAGLADAMVSIQNGGSGDITQAVGGGAYAVDTHPEGSLNLVLTSTGTFGNTQRTAEIVAYDGTHPVFFHAIFAGNSSGDDTYVMEFGGTGTSGDHVTGDVYSGNDLSRQGDAVLDGTLRAQGDCIGCSGDNANLSIPDLVAMDYPHNYDFSVNAAFDARGTWTSFAYTRSYYGSGYGGYLVPSSDPCHIFEKNPNHRAPENNSTVGDDYYLEDYYAGYPSTHNTPITVSPTGNDKLYFIQGNLWIDGHPTFDYVVTSANTRLTIVVEGDVHVSDDIRFSDTRNSGLAIIALKAPSDPDGTHSGNVYIGDPIFGTIANINLFLYAEHNFYDQNLDESGSYTFTINGIMTAGDHVDINRDYQGPGHYEWRTVGGRLRQVWVPGTTQHSRMNVSLDNRIYSGALVLPGLPEIDPGTGEWLILSWRERS